MIEFIWVTGDGQGFEAARAVRREVFVEEQGFSDIGEFDETDKISTHIIGFIDGRPVCTGRLFPEGEAEAGLYHIGRVAVLASLRGQGVGLQMMEALADKARQLGGRGLILHSQADKADFYRHAGFTPEGEIFLDEGCPHVTMQRQVD